MSSFFVDFWEGGEADFFWRCRSIRIGGMWIRALWRIFGRCSTTGQCSINRVSCLDCVLYFFCSLNASLSSSTVLDQRVCLFSSVALCEFAHGVQLAKPSETFKIQYASELLLLDTVNFRGQTLLQLAQGPLLILASLRPACFRVQATAHASGACQESQRPGASSACAFGLISSPGSRGRW